MIIGIPKEIKNNENRVGMTPNGVNVLVKNGHEVFVQEQAGEGSGFLDEQYEAVGAKLLATAKEVYSIAEMIIKVKEPIAPEYDLIKEGQVLYTYLHLAPDIPQTAALLKQKAVGIAYETIELADKSLPLLIPMSEIAGRMATQVGAQFLEKPKGGAGILLGGVPGVAPAEVVVIGGGLVGTNAAKIAMGMGASVTILDISTERLRYLDDIFGNKLKTICSNADSIAQAVKKADLLIGAVLIPGAKAPCLVTEAMVKTMKPGSVIVDVAIDQGGCIETIDKISTHSDPIYLKHGVVHYSVANMPGAVARTSTLALTNATLPYALEIANKGWKRAVQENPALAKGVNVCNGKITYEAVAEATGLAAYTPLENLL
ncbi:MAG: alanine dehydrogenase [Clostridia bacterium]